MSVMQNYQIKQNQINNENIKNIEYKGFPRFEKLVNKILKP